MNAQEWKDECAYIKGTTKKFKLAHITDMVPDVPEMNYDVDTFIRYCKMQRDSALREGFGDVVDAIQLCIDDLGGWLT